MNIDYLTNEFIRSEVEIHGAQISKEECVAIYTEVKQLHDQNKFHHMGIYWIANRLAADKIIHPRLPKS